MSNDKRRQPDRQAGPRPPAGEILPGDQQLLWLRESDSLDSALAQLVERGFSQAPVCGQERDCLGVFRVSTVLKDLLEMRWFLAEARKKQVGNFIDLEPRFVGPEERVDDGIDWHNDGVALVRSAEGVNGIVTASDFLALLARHATAFFLLESIELSLRELFELVLPLEKHRGLVLEALAATGFPRPERLDAYSDLHFGQYSLIFSHPRTYELLDAPCSWDRVKLVAQVDAVRSIRNKVLHFRGRATPEEIKTLGEVAGHMALYCERARESSDAAAAAKLAH